MKLELLLAIKKQGNVNVRIAGVENFAKDLVSVLLITKILIKVVYLSCDQMSLKNVVKILVVCKKALAAVITFLYSGILIIF